jgi:hypothetical protein
MKHIVLIKSNNPGKFNYCKFGNYKDREGRLKELIDINGIKVSGFEMFQAIVTLDINKEYDKRLYEFLKDHPLIRGKFTIEDISSNEQQKAKSSIESAKAITTASKLEERDLRDLSLILGVDSKMEEMLLRAKVIQIANENPERFMSYLNDIDKEHRIFLKKALDKKILNKVNGVWKHNTLNIGLTEDQAIVWLKDNGDTYALLKHQLRTGKKEETKSLELEEVSQSKLNESSYIQEIENSK